MSSPELNFQHAQLTFETEVLRNTAIILILNLYIKFYIQTKFARLLLKDVLMNLKEGLRNNRRETFAS